MTVADTNESILTNVVSAFIISTADKILMGNDVHSLDSYSYKLLQIQNLQTCPKYNEPRASFNKAITVLYTHRLTVT